jgi:hypothetical protein
MEQATLRICLLQLRIVGLILIVLLPATFLISFKGSDVYLNVWPSKEINLKFNVLKPMSYPKNTVDHWPLKHGNDNEKDIVIVS